MKQSSRIRAITQIVEKLDKEEWSIVDLTLHQYGFSTTNDWNGRKIDYIINIIQDADDQTLTNLMSHFGLQVDNEKILSSSEAMDLIREIESQKALMISVSTGGSRIQQVNEEYKFRQEKLTKKYSQASLEDPNMFTDLWGWYGRWSDGSLPTYQSRRSFVNSLYQPIIQKLTSLVQNKGNEEIQYTGWNRVDRNLEKILNTLSKAVNEEDFQSIGLLCRECIISLAQAVYDPSIHPTVDGVMPSETDAKRMLEGYISATLNGSSNEEERKFARDSYQLAVTLQHRRTANFRGAALCVEATRSLVNIVSILSGKKDPK